MREQSLQKFIVAKINRPRSSDEEAEEAISGNLSTVIPPLSGYHNWPRSLTRLESAKFALKDFLMLFEMQ